MTRRKTLSLVILLLFTSLAVPWGLYQGDREATVPGEGSEPPEGSASLPGATFRDVWDDPSKLGATEDPETPAVRELLTRLSRGPAEEGEVLSRFRPIRDLAPPGLDPLPLPTGYSLVRATAAHPFASDADRLYVASLQPLPAELDAALAQVVLAHGAASALQLAGTPAASHLGALTLAATLDATRPVLESYINHPVWNRGPVSYEAARYTGEVRPLETALMELYAALGFDEATLERLEPLVGPSLVRLPAAYHDPLALVVGATADYQAAAYALQRDLALAQSHPAPEESEDGASELRNASDQVRAAVREAHALLAASPVGEAWSELGPWSDPLGIVVVGTPGADTYDRALGRDALARGAVNDLVNSTLTLLDEVGVANVSLGELGLPFVAPDEGSTSLDVGPNTTGHKDALQAGWHMIVLDPGGDDVYHNNAGGLDAGSIVLEVDAHDSASLPLVRDLLVDEQGRVCLPLGIVCEPTGLGGFAAFFLEGRFGAQTDGLGTGLPLAAVVLDAAGDDTYLDTGEVIQGAARGLALGLLVDADGNDVYHAQRVAQGAGEFYGRGELVDLAGDDHYLATERAQGWAVLPATKAILRTQAFFGIPFDTPAALGAGGALVDLEGHDQYLLADLLSGQGVTDLETGFLLFLAEIFAHPAPNRAGGVLVDLGGPEHLPIPIVPKELNRGFGEAGEVPLHHQPSRVNVSESTMAEFWYMRELYCPDFGCVISDDGTEPARFRVKNAAHATTRGTPPLVGSDVDLGAITTEWNEMPSVPFIFLADTLDLDLGTGLLFFGQPDRLDDPAALTLTFGGDTVYNGTIAVSRSATLPIGTRGFFGDTFLICVGVCVGFDPVGLQLPVTIPAFLVDLQGNDTYLGENETIGFAAQGGLALLVDTEGSDQITVNDRSVAYAIDTGSVAAILDLDGRLAVQSRNETQAHAVLRDGEELSRRNEIEPRLLQFPVGPIIVLVNHLENPTNSLMPAVALLDLGANRNLTGEGAWLQARNRSQGYAVGGAIALLVGSAGDDRYFAGGWGQGFHDGQQILSRTCDFEMPADVPTVGNAVANAIRPLTPWYGGVGALLDPSGNDVYALGTRVGMGDVRADLSNCPEINQVEHINVLGLGTLLDVRGADSYQLSPVPKRPINLGVRMCSGPMEDASQSRPGERIHHTCFPAEDRAWSVVDHNSTASPTLIFPQIIASLGLGIDNVRNLHHAAVALCRGYDVSEPRNPKSPGTDDTIGTCSGYLALAGALVGSQVGGLRTPTLSLATPVTDAPDDGGEGGPGDRYDLNEILYDAASLPRTAVESLPVGTGLGLQPLFFHDTALPVCRTQRAATRVAAEDVPHITCLTVEAPSGIGTWIGNDPASDPLDPGDTLGCNCSARLTLRPAQGESISLSSAAGLPGGLYPTDGSATTYSLAFDRWYDASRRFEQPANVGPELTTLGVRLAPSAAFPIDLSALPQGLGATEITVTLEDALSEETGGVVPPGRSTYLLPLIDERAFVDAFIQEGPAGHGLFLAAPGPVSRETEIEVVFDPPLTPEERSFLTTAGFEDEGVNVTLELPSDAPLDGPTLSRAAPLVGPTACAALLHSGSVVRHDACWTGMELVVGFGLEGIDPARVQEVRVDGRVLPLRTIPFEGQQVEVAIEHASDESYFIEPVGRVTGLSGVEVLEAGRRAAERVLGTEVKGMWALINVTGDRPGTVGAAPSTLADPFVTIWYPEDDDDPVVLRGKFPEDPDATESIEPSCTILELNGLEEAREALDRRGLRGGCVVWRDGPVLSYLVPLGPHTGTRLVQLSAEVLGQDGRVDNETFTLHVDPIPARGQLTLGEDISRVPLVNVSLTAFADTLEVPRLRGGDDSDLVAIALEVRDPNGTWVELDVFETIPTPRSPTAEATVPLGAFLDPEAAVTRIAMRGVLVDESANRNLTATIAFVVDREPPKAKEVHVLREERFDVLVVLLDEDAFLSCGPNDCRADPTVDVPGANVEPILDLPAVTFGTRSVHVPVSGLLHGIPYEISLRLRDAVGNEGSIKIPMTTAPPVEVGLLHTEGELVNRTLTLSWSSRLLANETLESSTSAFLLLPDGPCAVLQGFPGIEPPGKAREHALGPLPMGCTVPEEAMNATLLLYTIAPAVGGIALDSTTVRLDALAPRIELTAPTGWINGTGAVRITYEDALPVTGTAVLDDEARTLLGPVTDLVVRGEGEHTLRVEATDAAGNRAENSTKVLIDQTPPTVSASVVGRVRNLALIEVDAKDALSGVDVVQVSAPSGTSSPEVPVVAGEGVLLSTLVGRGDTELVVSARDEAGNARFLRIPLGAGEAGTGEALSGLAVTAPSPGRLQVVFTTPTPTTPLVLVDAGLTHLERVLPLGTQHGALFEGLPPGATALVTVALPNGESLDPVATASATIPQDREAPAALSNVRAEPVRGGVRLAWATPSDDVGIESVLIERDGVEIARARSNAYIDATAGTSRAAYRLAAIDLAGNQGPWSSLEAAGKTDVQITGLAFDPPTATPDTPVTVTATVQVPEGVTPDLVTLKTWASEVAMEPVSMGGGIAVYSVRLRLPALDVNVVDPSLEVEAHAAGTTEAARFPAPLVTLVAPETFEESESGVPAPGLFILVLAAALAALVSRRRWSL